VRDIMGNPFRNPVLDPSWLLKNDLTAWVLAEALDHERRVTDLPILADALEDAGCSDQDVLNHCRSGGEHVRGCWVVDLVRSVD
jgi:hypothetical protein